MDEQKEPQVAGYDGGAEAAEEGIVEKEKKADRQQQGKVDEKQAREGLRATKARLTEQAGSLSIKEYMAEHPYLTLGAAFFAGAVLGCTGEGREKAASTIAEAITKELFSRGKEERKS